MKITKKKHETAIIFVERLFSFKEIPTPPTKQTPIAKKPDITKAFRICSSASEMV